MASGRVVRVRTINSTALIYCEGAHDLAFLRHLIRLYSEGRKLKRRFRSRQGKGGSPAILVVEAVNIPGDFDRRLVKVDRDRAIEEVQKAENLADRHNITITWSEPCIEALLMAILDGNDYSAWKSTKCKSTFESKCIPANKRNRPGAYVKHFPKELLEEARKRIPELDELIRFITD